MDVSPERPFGGANFRPCCTDDIPVKRLGAHHQGAPAAGDPVVALDQIGFGNSSKPGFAGSFARCPRDARAHRQSRHRPLRSGRASDGRNDGGPPCPRLRPAHRPSRARFPDRPRGLSFLRATGYGRGAVERERAPTADGYRKQLMTNYAISLPSSRDRAVRPVARWRSRRAANIRAGCKSFVNSYQMSSTQPVANEIPLIDGRPWFIMVANDHGAGRAYARPQLATRWARMRLSRNRWRGACRMQRSWFSRASAIWRISKRRSDLMKRFGTFSANSGPSN